MAMEFEHIEEQPIHMDAGNEEIIIPDFMGDQFHLQEYSIHDDQTTGMTTTEDSNQQSLLANQSETIDLQFNTQRVTPVRLGVTGKPKYIAVKAATPSKAPKKFDTSNQPIAPRQIAIPPKLPKLVSAVGGVRGLTVPQAKQVTIALKPVALVINKKNIVKKVPISTVVKDPSQAGTVLAAAMSTNEEVECCCRLCKKEFISETALKNHAKSEHFEVYSQGDPDKWTAVIKQKQSAGADLESKAKNIVIIDTERPTIFKKETIVSSLVPAPLTTFANLGVNNVILKEEDDNINPPLWKRKSRAKLKSERKLEYSCVLCNAQLLNVRRLKYHIKKTHIMSTPNENLCDICGKKYQSKISLRFHQRHNHLEARDFSCSICQKGFSNGEVLRIHERIHSGERPYCCAVCEKTFAQKGSLMRHHRVHTGAKPYVCQLCKKSYAQSHALKKHVNRAHCTI